jgi:hypothetical protein
MRLPFSISKQHRAFFARIGPNARRFRSLRCSRRRAPRSTRAAGSAGLHYAAGPWVGSCASCTSSSLGRHCRNARSAASLRSKRWRPPHDEHQSSRGSDAPETAPTWRQEGQMIEMSMPLSYHVCRAPGALQRILARLAGDGAARAGRTSRVLQARIALQSSRALRSRHTCQSVPLVRRHNVLRTEWLIRRSRPAIAKCPANGMKWLRGSRRSMRCWLNC